MSTPLLILFGTFFFALVAAPLVRPNAMKRALARARTQGDFGPLLTLVERAPKQTQPDLWDQAISQLWQRYERELVAKLLLEAAPRSDAKIIQHWLRQLLEIEPEIAKEHLSEAFLLAHFKPEVASKCGRCGCS